MATSLVPWCRQHARHQHLWARLHLLREAADESEWDVPGWAKDVAHDGPSIPAPLQGRQERGCPAGLTTLGFIINWVKIGLNWEPFGFALQSPCRVVASFWQEPLLAWEVFFHGAVHAWVYAPDGTVWCEAGHWSSVAAASWLIFSQMDPSVWPFGLSQPPNLKLFYWRVFCWRPRVCLKLWSS